MRCKAGFASTTLKSIGVDEERAVRRLLKHSTMGRKLPLDVFSRASLQPPDPERSCQHCSQYCKRYDELIHSTPPAVTVEFGGKDIGEAVPLCTVILRSDAALIFK